MLDFLAKEFSEDKGYSSLNIYRSALSSILPPVDGFSVGSYLTVSRLLKWAFHLKPPQPKYSFWSVDQVLAHIKTTMPLMEVAIGHAFGPSYCRQEFRSPQDIHTVMSRGVVLKLSGLAKQNTAKLQLYTRNVLPLLCYFDFTTKIPIY